MEAGTLTAEGQNAANSDGLDLHGGDEFSGRLFPVSGTLLSLTSTGSLPVEGVFRRGDVLELHVRAVVRHTGETDEVDGKTKQAVDAKAVVKAAVVEFELLSDHGRDA